MRRDNQIQTGLLVGIRDLESGTVNLLTEFESGLLETFCRFSRLVFYEIETSFDIC